jgi:hypothetical protein
MNTTTNEELARTTVARQDRADVWFLTEEERLVWFGRVAFVVAIQMAAEAIWRRTGNHVEVRSAAGAAIWSTLATEREESTKARKRSRR